MLAPPKGLLVLHSKIFKNLLWNCKAQSFDILHVASPNGALLSLFKLWPPRAYQFFIVKTLKNLLLWNRKAHPFDSWYVVSPNWPLPILFKLWPLVSKWPSPRAYKFFNWKSFKTYLDLGTSGERLRALRLLLWKTKTGILNSLKTSW